MRSKKVLIADDDPIVRRLVRRKLESEGYKTFEAGDGDAALKVFDQERPQIVIMDIHMPKLDGMSALDMILNDDPSAGVIMMTGAGDRHQARVLMDRGACGYLFKPLDLGTLSDAVAANLYARL